MVWQHLLQLPLSLFIPNLITVVLFTTTSLYVQITRLQQIQNSLVRAVVKTPKSCHTTPILRSLHWLKIITYRTHRMQAIGKFLQPRNLRICITSSLFSLRAALDLHLWSVATLACPRTPSLLWITDRSFSMHHLVSGAASIFSTSTASQSLYLSLISSYACHIVFLCSFATLMIHNSCTLSLPAQTYLFHNSVIFVNEN